MKIKLSIVLSLLVVVTAFTQKIRDPNFAQAIRYFCPTCLDNANIITEEGKKLRSLVVSIQQISDLTGVEGFSSLVSLNCENNNLTFIPPLPQSLQRLLISYNKLDKLTNLPSNLTALYCKGNLLKTLPDLPQQLQILDCSHNNISVLPTLPTPLKILFCSNNLLSILPTLPKQLEGLECGDNKLKNLPSSLPKSLSILSCQNNIDLVCLPRLPDSLQYLYISKGITCLPNTVKNASILQFEGVHSKPIALPLCTNIQLAQCPPLLTEPIDNGKKLIVFPNPTEGVLTISQQGYTIDKILIYNYLGQITKQLAAVSEIDFTTFAAGWYLVQIHTNDGIFSEKIIRQ